jgi:peptidyl-prolyl cis-trans isomerase D
VQGAKQEDKMPQNRKFLAQKQKEERQKKIIIIATITVLVIVFGLVIYGVLDRYLLKPQSTIVELEDETVKADEFEQLVRWSRRNLILEVDQILNTFQQLGGSMDIFAYFQQQLMQDVTTLQNPLQVGQDVIENLKDELIMRVEAKKLGIVVDDARIDREIEEAFGYYANGTPTPEPTRELPESLQGNSSSTATATPEATAESAPDPTATPLLQPTEYTEEMFSENYQQFLDSIKADGITEKTIRRIVTISVIRQELQTLITKDVSRTQEQVWIRHILVADEETAKEVAARIAAGEDFAALAAEYSLDTSNKDEGGDLGWFPRGTMVQEFEDAAFALEVGETSDPVQTDFGWHILQSLGKDDLLMEPTAYNQLLNQTFNDWLDEKRQEYSPVVNPDWVNYVPSEPVLPQDYVSYIQGLISQQSMLPTDIPLPEVTLPADTPEPQE